MEAKESPKIPNIMYDTNIRLSEKGLYMVIQRFQQLNPEYGQRLSIEILTNLSSDGRNAIQRSIGNLIASGYLKREKVRVKGEVGYTMNYILCNPPLVDQN